MATKAKVEYTIRISVSPLYESAAVLILILEILSLKTIRASRSFFRGWPEDWRELGTSGRETPCQLPPDIEIGIEC
jgi:hypothetical protein